MFSDSIDTVLIKSSISTETVELGEFLKMYNTLEMVIIDAASYIDGWSERWAGNDRRPPQMMQALQFLLQKEIINNQEVDRINEIRRYRNLAVHSISPERVNKRIYDVLKDMIDSVMNKLEKDSKE